MNLQLICLVWYSEDQSTIGIKNQRLISSSFSRIACECQLGSQSVQTNEKSGQAAKEQASKRENSIEREKETLNYLSKTSVCPPLCPLPEKQFLVSNWLMSKKLCAVWEGFTPSPPPPCMFESACAKPSNWHKCWWNINCQNWPGMGYWKQCLDKLRRITPAPKWFSPNFFQSTLLPTVKLVRHELFL